MRKLIMRMSISVDGFVSSPDGKNDWVFKTSDKESKAKAVEQFWDAGLIIMGRKSFDGMATYWPTSTDPFAAPMNEIPKAVFTKGGYKGFDPWPNAPATAASWADARIFSGDLAAGIRDLKAGEGKPILAIGGAGFMRSLIAADLIDEFRLITHPVVLGAGIPVFDGLATPLYLKLIDVKAFPGGITVHRYSR